MKFFTDENIGLSVVGALQDIGHDTVSITEIRPGMSDWDVLALAIKERRILITSDTDFGELVYLQKQKHVGIILLRLTDQTNENKTRVLTALLASHAKQLKNAFVVVTEASIRIR